MKTDHKTLILHIPKTGGTTLSYIYQATFSYFYPGVKILEQNSVEPNSEFYRAAASDNFDFVAGHIPIGIVNKSIYSKKITIIRDPVDILASLYSFGIRYNIDLVSSDIFDSPIFQQYFAPVFYLERFCIEKDYGSKHQFNGYYLCESVSSALDQLSSFDLVIDFNNYNNDVHDLIIRENLYPFSKLPTSRKYEYDKLTAREFALTKVSDFDKVFYDSYLDRRIILQRPNSSYQKYRADFCAKYGIDIEVGYSKTYDLSLPVGLGWHAPEVSDIGRVFRWGEPESTIELPVQKSGIYCIYIYIGNCRFEEIDCGIYLEQSGHVVKSSLDKFCDLMRLSVEFRLEASSWIVISLSGPPRVPNNLFDLRSCAFTLGNICVERTA